MSVSNFAKNTLKSDIAAGATSIDIDTATSPYNNMPSAGRGFLTDSLDSPTKWEEIAWTGQSAITGGFTLTGVSRNADSSTGSAQSFDAGHFVVQATSANGNHSGALVNLTANESISNNTQTEIPWDAEDYDDESIWSASPNPTRLTVPSGYSRAIISSVISFASNGTGKRIIEIRKNGGSFVGRGFMHVGANSTGATVLNVATALVSVSSGDYFEIRVFQSSGGALNVESGGSWFAMRLYS